MKRGQVLDPHATEDLNRIQWFLTETGEFPTVDALLSIRAYRRALVLAQSNVRRAATRRAWRAAQKAAA